MEGFILHQPWAAAVVNAEGTVLKASNCTVSKDEDHVYTITLGRELDESQCDVNISIRGNDGMSGKASAINHVSDTVKEIRFFYGSAGTAQATSFHVSFFRI